MVTTPHHPPLRKYGGDKVQVYGSWSKFQVPVTLNKSKEPPLYPPLTTIPLSWHEATVYILVGTYEFKYCVDGVWKHDPSEPLIPDAYGGFNNSVLIHHP